MEISKKTTMYRIADIEYSNSQFDERIIGVFRFESSGHLKRGPTLLVLAEIDGVGYVYDQLIDVVNNEAEHSRNLTANVEQDPVTRFEKIVQNVNEAVAAFVKQETAPINWTRMNMYLMELSEGHLCLAGIGRLMNMFLQAQEDGTFKTYDLFGSLDRPADVDPEKVFSNIICGDFRCGDLLIAGSKNFERLRNELRIKERMTTLPPVTAALEVKRDLEARSIPDDFVAAIIACLPADEPKAAPGPVLAVDQSTASIENLRRTEAEALRYLAPTFGKKDEPERVAAEPETPKARLRQRFNPLTYLQTRLTRRTTNVANMVNLRGMHAGFGALFTKRKKTLLIGGAGLILALILIGAFIKHRQNNAAQNAAWNSAYDAAKALVARAEGEAVYAEDRARATLASALAALEKLDTGTTAREEAVEKLNAETATLRKKLQRIQQVNAPTPLFSLADGIADDALSSPLLFKEKLVFLDRSANRIISLDPTTKETKMADLPANAARPVALVAGRSSIIVVLEDKTLLAADPETGTTEKISIGNSNAKNFTDALTYANRLYILDAADPQIWKFSSSGSGFGSGTAYLQATNTDLSKAFSLAIDANVYVLSSDGSLARFMSGGQDGFALGAIDPPLTSANQIWTDADADIIAIADRAGKRIVVFTKEGRLVGQYVSDAFTGPTDIAGDPKTKNLYITDSSNKIYTVPMP